MKLYRNLKGIERKETLGRRLSLAGLGILFLGLLASFIPTWFPLEKPAGNPAALFLQHYWAWISFAALPLGFVLASIGSYYINRFARRRWPGSKAVARPDEVLERNMKGFDDKYAYFAWSLPASYVVVGPCGVLVFAVRSDRGRVMVRGDKWREPFSIGRIFTIFAREGVGNPSMELQDQARKIREIIGETQNNDTIVTDGETANGKLANVPIEGAAVFLNPEMEIDVENPSIPALRADQVKEFIRRKAKDVKLQTGTVRDLTNVLAQNSTFQEEKGS